jgi:hypothetical protein
MIALAVDIKTAQTRVGHRRASTTLDIYAQPSRTADRAAAEALGSHFFPPPTEGSDHPPENPAQTVGERPPARDKRAIDNSRRRRQQVGK